MGNTSNYFAVRYFLQYIKFWYKLISVVLVVTISDCSGIMGFVHAGVDMLCRDQLDLVTFANNDRNLYPPAAHWYASRSPPVTLGRDVDLSNHMMDVFWLYVGKREVADNGWVGEKLYALVSHASIAAKLPTLHCTATMLAYILMLCLSLYCNMIVCYCWHCRFCGVFFASLRTFGLAGSTQSSRICESSHSSCCCNNKRIHLPTCVTLLRYLTAKPSASSVVSTSKCRWLGGSKGLQQCVAG